MTTPDRHDRASCTTSTADTTTVHLQPRVEPFDAGDSRGHCACGEVDLQAGDLGAELVEHDGTRHGAPACLRADRRRPALAELVEPADVVDKLLREVDAGRALVSLTVDDWARRHDLLDTLALVRDLLDDARQALDDQAQPAGWVEAGHPHDDAQVPL